MGFRGDYILANALPAECVEILGITRLAEVSFIPQNSAWIGRLKNGWTIFQPAQQDYCELVQDSVLALSAHGWVVTCSVDETGMASKAFGYENGLERWGLAFDADRPLNEKPLVETGELPDISTQVLADVMVRKAGLVSSNDESGRLFECPIRVVEEITGYCYDGVFSIDDFEVLYPVQILTRARHRSGIISQCMKNSPIMTLFLLLVMFALGAVLLGAVLSLMVEPFIGFVLGDWGDICLSNCATDPNE